MRAVVVVILTALIMSGCAPGAGQGGAPHELRVAAAADLTFALSEIVDEFERSRPGTTVKVSYGSSGQFVQQIASGAPFDVYLSADAGYVLDLVDSGHADAADTFDYAVGRLVLFAGESAGVDPAAGLDVLADDAVRAIAIANPAHAPYGRAAVAAMRSAGVYSEAEPKFVLGENISQAAEFVLSGNAQVGVVALALAVSPRMRAAGDYAVVPARLHPPLRQGGAVLSRGVGNDAATGFVSFLTGDSGQQTLRRYGFEPPITAE